MTQRAFNTSLILLAAAVALSGTSFPGGMLGFLLAIGFVIFIGVPAASIAKAFNLSELPLTFNQFAAILAGGYALFVVISAVQAWRLLQQRDLHKARSAGFGVAVLLALPLVGWLSLRAMTHA
ncbi:hypothetical protein [Bradyrhizobium sp. JYMT SZCCT0180]|uniref:hypothetical protein n=1 Tax=Bradyrhizobium sp. JYMT SZCCT0180 TaxID=2807666 RepID=UPI001BA9769A|nr:hypothetical protein [Bradyrhizobium sp. JYMT SZCCT0180]MBR1209743.1 hypothetical protein [Bradyrhizobium sp. JYMT SZCCT0180]